MERRQIKKQLCDYIERLVFRASGFLSRFAVNVQFKYRPPRTNRSRRVQRVALSFKKLLFIKNISAMNESLYQKDMITVIRARTVFFYIDNQTYCTDRSNIKRCWALVTAHSSEFSTNSRIESNSEENGEKLPQKTALRCGESRLQAAWEAQRTM